MANKLELTWYGKDEPLKIEPRLLIENTALSNTASDPDTENMIIHGDNLLALKALESKYAGKVKCIYIEPCCDIGSHCSKSQYSRLPSAHPMHTPKFPFAECKV